jgi:cellulose synthase/poly-beta-1,6-N-acetylglucosamine synthase-like glycosyltransferase
VAKVSIIIATKNRPHLLPRAVESAHAAGKDVEVVVVDDGSIDQTAEVCSSLSNILYVRVERNQGVAGARNIGVLASTGEYITFLDDDDTRLPNSLELQVQALDSDSQSGLVYAQALQADVNGEIRSRVVPQDCPDGDVFWELLERNFMPCGSVLFRRSCLSRVGLLDHAIAGIDDWDLWIRIAEFYPVRAIKQPVIIYRQSRPASGQGTSDAAKIVRMSTRQFQGWINVPRAAQASAGRREAATREFSQNIAAHLTLDMGRAFAKGRVIHAAKDLGCLLRSHPGGFVRMIQRRAASELSSNRQTRMGGAAGH